jgi:hypothetical protein
MPAAQETGWTVKPHHSGRFPAARIAYSAPRDEPESGAPAQCNSAGMGRSPYPSAGYFVTRRNDRRYIERGLGDRGRRFRSITGEVGAGQGHGRPPGASPCAEPRSRNGTAARDGATRSKPAADAYARRLADRRGQFGRFAGVDPHRPTPRIARSSREQASSNGPLPVRARRQSPSPTRRAIDTVSTGPGKDEPSAVPVLPDLTLGAQSDSEASRREWRSARSASSDSVERSLELARFRASRNSSFERSTRNAGLAGRSEAADAGRSSSRSRRVRRRIPKR